MGLDIYLYKDKKEVCYFRKVNVLYGYCERNNKFIDKDFIASLNKNDIEYLINTSKDILSKKDSLSEEKFEKYSSSILPCSSGFLFGSTKYDDNYIYQLECIIDELSKIKDDIKSEYSLLIEFDY